MNQELVDRYVSNHDVQAAIAACKAAGQVVVSQGNSRGLGSGFYGSWTDEYGRPGLTICGPCATEDAAWTALVIQTAKFKPGVLQMTSRDFGHFRSANILCADGTLGVLERRSRLEIRKISGQYEVFLMERRHLGKEEPYDIRQHPQGRAFKSLADAAGYVGDFISDYEGAAAEERADAIEAHRERERQSV